MTDLSNEALAAEIDGCSNWGMCDHCYEESAQFLWSERRRNSGRNRGEVAVIMRNRGATYREIGDYLGVTASRAMQIERAGLRRRHTWASAGQCRCLYGQEMFSRNYPECQ